MYVYVPVVESNAIEKIYIAHHNTQEHASQTKVLEFETRVNSRQFCLRVKSRQFCLRVLDKAPFPRRDTAGTRDITQTILPEYNDIRDSEKTHLGSVTIENECPRFVEADGNAKTS